MNFLRVSIKKVSRIDKSLRGGTSNQRRLITVVLGSSDELNQLLANVHNLSGSDISVRPYLSLED